MNLEHRKQPPLAAKVFLHRLLRYSGVAVSLLLVSLAIGVIGYRLTEGMSWIDALLNASMILGGMGPVAALHTDAGKLFASFYALFAGGVFLIAFGVFVTPVVHRLLHQFHVDPDVLDNGETG